MSSSLDKNQTAEKGEFEDKQKELEKVCMPIMTKLYQAGGVPNGAGGMSGGPSGSAGSGGKVLPLRKWTKSQTVLVVVFNLYVLCTVIVFCQFVKSFCTLHKIV